MKMTSLCGTTALALCLTSQVALADVTPEQIWENWQKLGNIFGQELTVESAERDGDTLVVTGIKTKIDLSFGMEGEKISSTGEGTIDEMRFRDLGDGSVEVTMSDTYTGTSKTTGPDGKVQDQTFVISQPGFVVIASGDPDATTYDMTAPTLSIRQTISMDGKEIGVSESTLTNLESGAAVTVNGENLDVDSAGKAERFDLTSSGSEAPDEFVIKMSYADFGVAVKGTMPPKAAFDNPATLLDTGFGGVVDLVAGKGTYNFDIKGGGTSTLVEGSGEGGALSFAFGKDGFSYSAKALASETTIKSDAMPVPEVKVSYSAAGFDFAMPLAESPEPKDFTFGIQLVDLAMSDAVWGLFDPTGELPRDPASVIIDTTGKMRIPGNMFDTSNPDAAVQPELHALTINDISALVAGAALTGKGGLTFDNTDLVTFGGMPKPTGKIDLTLAGGNTLLDKLVKIGLLPEDQAQGFRMMVAMFAKPGEGEDVLQSTLEFKDGGFFANGMQLQ